MSRFLLVGNDLPLPAPVTEGSRHASTLSSARVMVFNNHASAMSFALGVRYRHEGGADVRFLARDESRFQFQVFTPRQTLVALMVSFDSNSLGSPFFKTTSRCSVARSSRARLSISVYVGRSPFRRLFCASTKQRTGRGDWRETMVGQLWWR